MVEQGTHKPLVSGPTPLAASFYLHETKEKATKEYSQEIQDFSLEDILNAPKPKEDVKVSGCTNCGSLKYISKGAVKVFRGQRMKTYHCHDCGFDFYKPE